MEMTYKYSDENDNRIGRDAEFIDNFIDRKDDFLNRKFFISTSCLLSENQTILQLFFDFDKKETNEPNSNVNVIFDILNDAFKPLNFSMELHPNGVLIVSNFTYLRMHDMTSIKKQLRGYFTRVKDLNLNNSFTTKLIPRIGFDQKKHFFYAPMDETSNSSRNYLMMKGNPYSEEYWLEYVSNMIPINDISFMSLVKSLETFDEMTKNIEE